MLVRNINDSQHWRSRAAQMRGIAIKMMGTEAAILINDLADEYDRLAEKAAAPAGIVSRLSA
jgi:hypothetical protein